MSNNGKNEEKWTVYLRDDQIKLIIMAMELVTLDSSEKGNGTFSDFDQMSARIIGDLAQEISDHLVDTIS